MIERGIITAFEKWREGQITRWNRLCSRSFKSVMAKFEEEAIKGEPLEKTLNSSQELSAIRNVYNISGFPLHFPYTDVDTICSAMHNTSIHTHMFTGVEYALAVHCVSYPNKFVSVWVYLASLSRK